MTRVGQSSSSFDAKKGSDALSVEGLLACWRDPSTAVLSVRLNARSDIGALADLLAVVRPAARELAHILKRGEPAALIGAALDGDRGGGIPPASLADDLLASALLIEGILGDPTAQLVVDHLRGRRGLEPLVWPNGGGPRRAPRDARARKRPGNQQKFRASSDPAMR
jgi:hypothetical protein